MENEGDVVPPGVLKRVRAALLGTTVDVHAAAYGEGDAIHLRLRPRRWPTEYTTEGAEEVPTRQGVRLAQGRVADDLAQALPLLDVTAHTCALDRQPEIGVRLPGAAERRRAAAVHAARHPLARLLDALFALLVLVVLLVLVHEWGASLIDPTIDVAEEAL